MALWKADDTGMRQDLRAFNVLLRSPEIISAHAIMPDVHMTCSSCVGV